MSTFNSSFRILLLLLALCAITAYCAPLAQQPGEDFVAIVTVATVTVQPTGASRSTGAPEPTSTGLRRYVPNPNRRGTVGILMSCILTLILCVWTTVNVNIEPAVKLSAEPGWIEWIDHHLARRAVRKVGWSLTSLIVPEATLSVAAFERCTAKLLQIKMKKIIGKSGSQQVVIPQRTDDPSHQQKAPPMVTDGVVPPDEGKNPKKLTLEQWEDLAMSYYAIMGGFRIIYDHDGDNLNREGVAPAQEGPQEDPRTEPSGYPQYQVQPEASRPNNKVVSTPVTGTPVIGSGAVCDYDTSPQGCKCQIGFLSNMTHGNTKKCPWYVMNANTRQSAGTLTPHGVIWMAEQGWLPNVSANFVRDKSKANALAKVLVCFQAFWMIIQAIGRVAANQSVTLLELHTVLHAVCAGTMYLTWWDKPVDIEFPTEFFLTKHQFEELQKISLDKEGTPNPTNPFSKGKIHSGDGGASGDWDSKYVTSRAGLGVLPYQQLSGENNILRSVGELGNSFHRIIRGRANLVWEGTCLCTVGLIYGGVHLATWENFFETEAERYLWKGSAVVSAAAVVGFVLELCIGALIKSIIDAKVDAKKAKKAKKATPEQQAALVTPQPTVGGEKATKDSPDFEKHSIKDSIKDVKRNPTAPSGQETTPIKRRKRPEELDRKRDILLWSVYKGFVAVTFYIGIIIVIFARLFLLVESFIALRGQPDGAYDTVNWVESVPHAG